MKKREAIHQKRLKEARKKRIIAGISIVAGILLISCAYIIPSLLSKTETPVPTETLVPTEISRIDPTTTTASIITPGERDYSSASGNNLGDANAPVKVVIFSNFYCSHCKAFAQEQEEQIVNDYVKTGKVYLTEMAFTWTDPAYLAARASYCASEQDKFWQYRDIVFANVANTSLGTLDENNLTKLAESIGLDTNQFSTCLSSDKSSEMVDKDIAAAEKLGIQGTPSFVVNGTIVYSNTLVDEIESQLGN